MSVSHVEVVVGAKNVGGDHRSVGTSMLLRIASIQNVDHTLSIAVPKIAIMGRS